MTSIEGLLHQIARHARIAANCAMTGWSQARSAATQEAEMVVRLQSRSGTNCIYGLKPGEDWRMLPDGTIVISGPSGVFHVHDGKRHKIKLTGHEGHVTVNFDRWGGARG